jgi:pimeloyl-ACP methyl ester carboxylesterase
LEIHYQESGSGIPLILLHGGMDTHKLWDPFFPHFSKRFRVFAPDSRGHGKTVNPTRGLSYRLMADDLAAFIQALDLDRPIVFGFSDGGQIALEIGMRYPSLTRGLVIAGAWYQFSEEYQKGLKRVGFEGPGKINYRKIDKIFPVGWRDRMRESHPRPDPDYYHIFLEDISQMWWTPLNYRLGDFQKIIQPTLILIGEDDRAVPLHESQEMSEMIPDAELAVIRGTGHNDLIVEGGEFLAVVDDFIMQIIE